MPAHCAGEKRLMNDAMSLLANCFAGLDWVVAKGQFVGKSQVWLGRGFKMVAK